jgi:hypothetical protein
VLNQGRREDVRAVARPVEVSGRNPQPKRRSTMSEEERKDSEETEDVEAHRRRAFADDASDQSEEDESDDVEAHRRRA